MNDFEKKSESFRNESPWLFPLILVSVTLGPGDVSRIRLRYRRERPVCYAGPEIAIV